MICELMGAFDRSKEEGQARWKKTREAVLRRRAEAEAHAKAEDVEAEAVKNYTERRKGSAPIRSCRCQQELPFSVILVLRALYALLSFEPAAGILQRFPASAALLQETPFGRLARTLLSRAPTSNPRQLA